MVRYSRSQNQDHELVEERTRHQVEDMVVSELVSNEVLRDHKRW